jgi:hypothetical protein
MKADFAILAAIKIFDISIKGDVLNAKGCFEGLIFWKLRLEKEGKQKSSKGGSKTGRLLPNHYYDYQRIYSFWFKSIDGEMASSQTMENLLDSRLYLQRM